MMEGDHWNQAETLKWHEQDAVMVEESMRADHKDLAVEKRVRQRSGKRGLVRRNKLGLFK